MQRESSHGSTRHSGLTLPRPHSALAPRSPPSSSSRRPAACVQSCTSVHADGGGASPLSAVCPISVTPAPVRSVPGEGRQRQIAGLGRGGQRDRGTRTGKEDRTHRVQGPRRAQAKGGRHEEWISGIGPTFHSSSPESECMHAAPSKFGIPHRGAQHIPHRIESLKERTCMHVSIR